jgi:NAD(P)-dependent dehydrogenase (short-subunit alcohol dehydrogenase family)
MERSGTSHPAAPPAISPGRVAVVTGAASGIGLGLAQRLAADGLRVVLADVEEPALAAAAGALASTGADVLPVVTDVSDLAAVEALRDTALDAYGAVHLLCNNAGVGGPHGPIWECPPGEWDWVLGVNLGGVINGLRAFMPVLLAQEAAHVLNTSSIFGVFAGALGPYGISKHAVTALTETLYFNLQALGATHVGVSVLCPGAVRTNFGTSARNRPAWAGPPPARVTADEQASPQLSPGGTTPRAPRGMADEEANVSAMRFDRLSALGASPAEVADIIVSGIQSGRFYILTSENRNGAVARRAREILDGAPPAAPFP